MTRPGRDGEVIRSRILTSGREIFSRRPYSDINERQICKHAGVSSGALRHHFGDKLGLFMSVVEGLQRDAWLRIQAAIGQHQESWDRFRAGIVALLDAWAEPAYQTILLAQGPAAIGWEQWFALDIPHYDELIQAIAETLAPTKPGGCAATMLVATLRGALNELSWEIAQSVDPVTARHHALAIIDCLLSKACESPQVTHTGAIPDRIGIRQLRIDLGNYIDRVAAGETIDVTRRGRVVARLQQPTN